MKNEQNKTTELLRKIDFSVYHSIRKQTENICAPLSPEDQVVQPVEFVSPPKWHLAHSTWFFENFLLLKFKPDYKVFNDNYNYLFNSYYESVGKRAIRTDRGNVTRPGVEEILRYRKYVDDAMESFLSKEMSAHAAGFLELGLHHEQQHQELLFTDIKYILGHNPTFPEYVPAPSIPQSKVEEQTFITVPEGIYEIGYNGENFCFDNERGRHKVFLHAFSYMNRLVTNGEFLDFINDGAYENPLLWLSAGLDWVKANSIKAPMYWHSFDGEWFNYTLAGLNKINISSPVTHVSYYEAEAFSRWKGKRLLTEFEWETACFLENKNIPNYSNFLDCGHLAPFPKAGGNSQFLGDAWEWTGSAYLPYPYYKQEPGALGEYNGKFMVNQMVLRGGSCVTPRNHIRVTYRNFFYPHERWQFTGVRLAQTL